MNHGRPFFCFLIGIVKARLVYKWRQHLPAAVVRIIDNHTVSIRQQLKMQHIAGIRAHGAEEITGYALQKVNRQHGVIRHLSQQRQVIIAADGAGHINSLGFRQTQQLNRLPAFCHFMHIFFNAANILCGELTLAVILAVERASQGVAHLQMYIGIKLFGCRNQHKQQRAHINTHAYGIVDFNEINSAVGSKRTLQVTFLTVIESHNDGRSIFIAQFLS